MKPAAKKLRSPLKHPGGKTYLARRIIKLFPEHRTYVEPFVGGGSVLLNKPPAEQEIVGDTNEDLINFWRIARSGGLLIEELKVDYRTPTFENAKDWLTDPFPQVRATGYLVRSRMSRGGLGKDFAWSDRQRGGMPGDVNAWRTALAELPDVARRIFNVEFRPTDALELIAKFDGPETLIYCDPPYLHETRTAKGVYGPHEMSEVGHQILLAVLKSCAGKVFISGYRSALYDRILAGWTRHEFDLPNHAGQGKTKQRRLECVWESPNK